MLSADDVQIRCSIRKAGVDSKKKFSEPEDMMCTMRIWHGSKTGFPMKKALSSGNQKFPSNKNQQAGCSEILLKPIQRHPSAARTSNRSDEFQSLRVSKRFASFGSVGEPNRFQMQQSEPTSAIGNVKLLVPDIVVVDMHGNSKSHTINLTTMSQGYYEFTMNRNGQEILLAFLKANLPKDRIMGCVPRSRSDVSHNTSSTSGNKSFDVEKLTTNKMTERIENETLVEKVRRKVSRAFASLEDLGTSMTECACHCGGGSTVTPQPSIERRDSPPQAVSEEKADPLVASARKATVYDCGLSVESEPEMESTH
eukprot:scaffold18138_cov128-Cylindrotheca_fusiformis.AAC.10